MEKIAKLRAREENTSRLRTFPFLVFEPKKKKEKERKVLIMEKLYNNGITDIRIYLRTNLYHTMSLAFFVFLTSFRTYGILRIYFIFS